MLVKEQNKWISILKNLDYPTPFKITDLSILQNRVKTLKELLPRVEIFYATKSNSDRRVIEALDKLVAGYDIASLGEFNQLNQQGVDPSKMLYSNPVKVPEHIKKTYAHGVKFFAYDSLDEIKKLAKYAPGANCYLRVKVSDYGSKFPLSKKFGIDPLHAVAYVGMALDHGLKANGLTFHVGSQSENLHTWQVALETCGEIIKRLNSAGIKIDFLNIGGGFPATYTEKISSVKQVAKAINRSIDKYIPQGIRIVAEPGRFVSAEASVIVSSVIGREHRGSGEWLFLDMGVFQGLIEPLEIRKWRYPIFTNYGRKAAVFGQPFVLTGPTCDAYDTIGFDYMLPSNIKYGDKIYIGATGAYTNVYESTFNGFLPPKSYYIESDVG